MNMYKDAMLECIQYLKDKQHSLVQDSLYQSACPTELITRLHTLSFCIGLLQTKLDYLSSIECERLHSTQQK